MPKKSKPSRRSTGSSSRQASLIGGALARLLNTSHQRAEELLAIGHRSERTLRQIKLNQIEEAEQGLLDAIEALLSKYEDAWAHALKATQSDGLADGAASVREKLQVIRNN